MKEARTKKNVTYLLFYNIVQAIGWTAVLASSLRTFMNSKNMSSYSDDDNISNNDYFLQSIYQTGARKFIVTFQLLAMLETVHAIARVVKSPIAPSFMQFLGRIHVLNLIDSIMPLQRTTACGVLILCWSLIDIVRYLSYSLGVCRDATPKWLTYLRYTLFIPLYPMGAAAEMKLMYDSIGFVKRVEMYYVSMPNRMNFAFDYSWFLYLVLALYPFLFAQMYFYMFAQRRRKLKKA